MSHLLSDLLDGVTDTAIEENVRVTGINSDSRAIAFGEVFFALPGSVRHGDEFAAMAVERGARVIVSDRPGVAGAADAGVATIVIDDVRAAYAKAAARVSGPPPEMMMAITGTNGKTSICSFVRQIWQATGIKGASIGTLGIDSGQEIVSGQLTTPDPLSLHRALAKLKADGIEHVIMEASSHGLDQRRLDGIGFKIVGYSNLSRDHLDYHPDMAAYHDAKLHLFRHLMVEGGSAVINADDPEHMPFLFGALERGATPLTVGAEGAYMEIGEIKREGWGQRVAGRLVGEPMNFYLPLAGEFQVSNALMAAAMAISSGVDKDLAIAALEHLEGARGRLERVATRGGAAIFVDYAHTPDALKTALVALRPYAASRLHVVFGAGGDRDKGKRAMMGRLASEIADMVIVTDDNPRTEDAALIRKQIMAGATGAREIGDRSEAIGVAVKGLEKGDILLIAGKGHEDYQIIGTTKQPFSDHDEVAKAVNG
ncbi:UDP-N-acetylmuramoylalanyl-D-glutamate--2,6-diaminopimelate ligase [hydrothermal vent metagenome]|uniref:UDP-N-acetylmuramoylalanyl-D-glutamate--2,6-diaminopimelate ligase n=1 Tax=hydrothermal vent metagenome TaxID=652676 RepID=A0A3B0TWR4_9ZZZZ